MGMAGRSTYRESPRLSRIGSSQSMATRGYSAYCSETRSTNLKEGKHAPGYRKEIAASRFQLTGSTLADKIDIGRPSRAFPVTPPGIRVPYHGGSDELSVRRSRYTRQAERVEIGIGQRLLDSRVSRHGPETSWGASGHCRSHVRHIQSP